MAEQLVTNVCIVCNELKDSDCLQSFCSRECNNVYDMMKLYDAVECSYCKNKFENKSDGHLFCSKECEIFFQYDKKVASLCQQCNTENSKLDKNGLCSSKCKTGFLYDMAYERRQEYIEDKRQDNLEDPD